MIRGAPNSDSASPRTQHEHADSEIGAPIQNPEVGQLVSCFGWQSLLAVGWRWDYFPPMIEAVEIERMSIAEKLQAMELLWRSMSAGPTKLKSPAWHGKVLSQRLAKVEAGQGKFLSLTQFKNRLAKRTA